MFKFYEPFCNLKKFPANNGYELFLNNSLGKLRIDREYYLVGVVDSENSFDNTQLEDCIGYMTFDPEFELLDYEFEDYENFYEVFEKAYEMYEEDLAFENEKEQKRVEGIKKFMGKDSEND
jgi:hypothetical protein